MIFSFDYSATRSRSPKVPSEESGSFACRRPPLGPGLASCFTPSTSGHYCATSFRGPKVPSEESGARLAIIVTSMVFLFDYSATCSRGPRVPSEKLGPQTRPQLLTKPLEWYDKIKLSNRCNVTCGVIKRKLTMMIMLTKNLVSRYTACPVHTVEYAGFVPLESEGNVTIS